MKTANEVMEVLSKQIDLISKDKVSNGTANAMCNTVGKLIGMQRLDLEFAKMTGQRPQLSWLSGGKPIAQPKLRGDSKA